MYRMILVLLLLLFCCGCAAEEGSPYLFPVEKEHQLIDFSRGIHTYTVTELESTEQVYGMLMYAFPFPPEPEEGDLFLLPAWYVFASRAPFTLCLKTGYGAFSSVPEEEEDPYSGDGEIYEGDAAYEIDGETWYTLRFDSPDFLEIRMEYAGEDWLMGEYAEPAPFYSEDPLESFLHAMSQEE